MNPLLEIDFLTKRGGGDWFFKVDYHTRDDDFKVVLFISRPFTLLHTPMAMAMYV